MIERTPVRDYYQRIIGYIDTDTVTGDKVGRDRTQWIVGYYVKRLNETQDRYRRCVNKGDMLAALIQQEEDRLNNGTVKNGDPR